MPLTAQGRVLYIHMFCCRGCVKIFSLNFKMNLRLLAHEVQFYILITLAKAACDICEGVKLATPRMRTNSLTVGASRHPGHERLRVNGWRFGSSAVRRSLTGWQRSSPLLAYSSLSPTSNIVWHTHTHTYARAHTLGSSSPTTQYYLIHTVSLISNKKQFRGIILWQHHKQTKNKKKT